MVAVDFSWVVWWIGVEKNANESKNLKKISNLVAHM